MYSAMLLKNAYLASQFSPTIQETIYNCTTRSNTVKINFQNSQNYRKNNSINPLHKQNLSQNKNRLTLRAFVARTQEIQENTVK